MAKKSTKKSRGTKTHSARPAKTAGRAAKSPVKAKPAARRAASKPTKAAARARQGAAGARAKAAAAAPRRTLKPRQQPETLRCKALSVALTADDVAASMKFYVDGVGFHVKQRWEKDGQLLGAELVAGACMIGLSQDDWAKGRGRTKGVGMSVYVETSQGVDALAARLRSRGLDFKAETTEWGWRQVSLTDPDGFRLIVYEETKR